MKEDQLERLAILAEECAEVQQMAMKIIRHGYASHNPFDTAKTSNRKLLEKELGDLVFAMALMFANEDISESRVQQAKLEKKEKIKPYLHHNEVD